MIYLIDEPIEHFNPIEEANKYIDAQFVSEGHMMFTPTILADPDKVLNSLSHDAINKECKYRHVIWSWIYDYENRWKCHRTKRRTSIKNDSLRWRNVYQTYQCDTRS